MLLEQQSWDITGRKEVFMSEIKGQLLGIILVIIVFGVVAAGVSTVFQNLTSSVSEEVAKAVTTNPKAEMLTF